MFNEFMLYYLFCFIPAEKSHIYSEVKKFRIAYFFDRILFCEDLLVFSS